MLSTLISENELSAEHLAQTLISCSLPNLKIKIVTLCTIVHSRLVLHMAKGAIAVMWSCMRIRFKRLGLLGHISLVVATRTSRLFRINRISLVRTMTGLASKTASNMAIGSEFICRISGRQSNKSQRYSQHQCHCNVFHIDYPLKKRLSDHAANAFGSNSLNGVRS